MRKGRGWPPRPHSPVFGALSVQFAQDLAVHAHLDEHRLALGVGGAGDGDRALLQDLGHVAAASGVRIDLDSSALAPDQPLLDVGAALGIDPISFVLTGGEDHALIACFPADAELPPGWRLVGTVAAPGRDGGGEAAAPQVTVDGAHWDGPPGWDHFR